MMNYQELDEVYFLQQLLCLHFAMDNALLSAFSTTLAAAAELASQEKKNQAGAAGSTTQSS